MLTPTVDNPIVNTGTKELIRAGVAENTLRAYRTSIKALDAWLNGRVLTDALLAEYLTELHTDYGRAPATISQVVAAVKWTAQMQADESGEEVLPPIGRLTQATMAGIRREGSHRGRGQVDGLTWEQVDRVVDVCLESETLQGLRDAVLIRLMSDCLLRVSEAVAVNCGDFGVRTLKVRKSKTDQEGRGKSLFVCDATRDLIAQYRERSGIERGAFFRRMHKSGQITSGRLTSRSARQIITHRAKQAGIEGFISGHSLRVGSAVSLARNGASLVQMQNAGRWKDSKMPAHYTESEQAEQGAIAQIRNKKGDLS